MSKFWSVAAAICTLAACAGVTGAQPLRCGAKVCEYDWTGIGGTKVTDLTGNRRFPNNPNYIRKITNGRFQMRQRGNNLGAMLEGYVKAPTSGRYTFSTQSDDASEVWVATRPNTRTTSLVKVVELTGCCRKINGRRQVQFNKGQAYYIRALVKEGGGGEYLNVGMKVGNKEYFPIPISMFKQVSFKSALRCGAKACEYDWTGIGGTKVSDLTRNKRFPNSPNSVKKLTNGRFEMRQKGNNLGAVLEGFVNAPTSGRYTFSTHSDDASEVWAARNAYTQEGLVKVVELTGCCRKINGRTQLSWTKGQAYYIRALVKEGGGGEYLRVGMKVGRKEYFPIPISMFTTIPPFCMCAGGKATVGNTCNGAGITKCAKCGAGFENPKAGCPAVQSGLACGGTVCEYAWTGIGGTKVRDLTRNKRFPNSPNTVRRLTNGRFQMRQRGNNLGAMLEGFVLAPTTGTYTFSTRSDDSSEVWAASRPMSQSGLVKVVELNGCCRKVNGNRKLKWTAGQLYYIRALVKEGGGGEYLYVGMRVGNTEYYPIPVSMFRNVRGNVCKCSGGSGAYGYACPKNGKSLCASCPAGTNMNKAKTACTKATSGLRCGAAVCEYAWTGIGGTKVRDLTRNKRFPNSPNAVRKLTSGRFETRQRGNNFGALLEGFVNAPTTGRYRFSTQSDDASEVWAASRPNTQEGLVKVVELTGCCRKINGGRNLGWAKGKAYYIRALVKEGGGGEYLKVGMRVGSREYFPIPVSMFVNVPKSCTCAGGKAATGKACTGVGVTKCAKCGAGFENPGAGCPAVKSGLRCGAAVCEYDWTGIGGTKVRDLTRNNRFPNSPNTVRRLTRGRFQMQQRGNNMGAMLEGFVLAPTTGTYTFSTRSDDSSEVWAASRPMSQSGLVKVVELNGCCRKVNGNRKLKWTAGQLYYIRALVKEGGGGEYLFVGMRVGNKEYYPIPVSMFRSVRGNVCKCSGGPGAYGYTCPKNGKSLCASCPAGTKMNKAKTVCTKAASGLRCGAKACEYAWTGIGGTNVIDLTRNKRFPNSPNVVRKLTSGRFEMKQRGNNLGAVLEGFVNAPTSGRYTFSTHSDDSSEV
eukprot:SAG25_NODE_480_length_7508_cov_8.128627_3_plen_1083_part_01